ncbi:uncharacterized protein isoform X1 [Salmo salar]|uniref:Uncharacterized protein LOC106574774 isoform X1 n=1 Tax=Salmo salar TaxID=8030 RepID=A0ABM3E7M7_SALSA|nr:uncharacterized protein LOC123727881 isoform X1 [Salmo salar]XP_045567074.1 uncharacterized protein LOC106574774 isoform X1 [Salmo salar]
MATMCHSRRALMEIPAPQPKIAARLRRSYLEVLSSRITPFSTTSRGRNLTSNSKRGHSLDPAIYRTGSSRSEAQSERMEDNQTPLSNQQLVQLIRSFILVEQGQRQEPRALTTDLKPIQEDLHLKKTNVYRSIPYSRLGSNRDAHCYRKAYPHLVVFKVSCQEWGQLLLQNEEWESTLEHALVAWRYTSELPQWDTSSHNSVREQCYIMLAAHCITALQHYCPDPSKAIELHRRFKMAQLHSQLIYPCIQELERSLSEAQVCSMNTR